MQQQHQLVKEEKRASEFDPSELLHHKQQRKAPISKGIFEKKEFKRMSFNTNPNKKSSEDKSLISVPDKDGCESICADTTISDFLPPSERRNSRSSPDKKTVSPGSQRRRSSAKVRDRTILFSFSLNLLKNVSVSYVLLYLFGFYSQRTGSRKDILKFAEIEKKNSMKNKELKDEEKKQRKEIQLLLLKA
ncbi:hypothetical protein Mgra_00003389 [Meloidogyne graminicola]|uniref:Uncharacterized protein n=1 Tax=Meloidogyne graminicola TaxID=189291 RepID=A0A8S9ZVN6_9BILA|nr:hypothetical protein Mgra_00003389 [Meloidogyne graminicola]